MAVRKMAESVGFEAFASSHTGSSVLHYGEQNMRVKKPLLLGAEGWKKVMGGKAKSVLCVEQ